MPDVDTYNEWHKSDIKLLQTGWNNDNNSAWMMYADLNIQTVEDNESEEESEDE